MLNGDALVLNGRIKWWLPILATALVMALISTIGWGVLQHLENQERDAKLDTALGILTERVERVREAQTATLQSVHELKARATIRLDGLDDRLRRQEQRTIGETPHKEH